ncbi:MAG: hypothetical protein L0G87_00400 [Renibacterium salmoninarum]|nr:hypothetical protein [Renibacterium salmoninarum]
MTSLKSKCLMVRILVALIAAMVLLTAGAGAASAADGSPPPPRGVLTDSSGVPVDNYLFLPIDRGAVVWNQDKFFWSKIIDGMWVAQLKNSITSLVIMDQATTFTWVDGIKAPADQIAQGFDSALGGIMWYALLTFIAGAVVAYFLFRRGVGAGLGELAVTVGVIAITGTFLLNPVANIAGSNGLISQAQKLGATTSAEVLTNVRTADGKPPAQVIDQAALQPMVDAFIRAPYQVAAFGKVIDADPQCKAVFDQAMKDGAGKQGAGDKIRQAVGSCYKPGEEVAANPDPLMLWNIMLSGTSNGFLNIFSYVLFGLLVLSVGLALYEAIKLIVTSKAGIVAGPARSSLYRSVVMVMVYGFCIFFSFIFINLYMLVIKSIFEWNKNNDPVTLWMWINATILFGTILMIIAWRRAKKKGQSLAQRLSQLGRRGPQPQAKPKSWRDVQHKIERFSSIMAMRNMGRSAKELGKTKDQNRQAVSGTNTDPPWGPLPKPSPAGGGPTPAGPGGGTPAGTHPGKPGPGSGSPLNGGRELAPPLYEGQVVSDAKKAGSPTAGGISTEPIQGQVIDSSGRSNSGPGRGGDRPWRQKAGQVTRIAAMTNPYSKAAVVVYDASQAIKRPRTTNNGPAPTSGTRRPRANTLPAPISSTSRR